VDCILVTRDGSAIRFNINDARPLGRATAGVKGVALRGDDEVVSCVVTGDPERDQLLTVSEGGFGKRTGIDQYRQQSRGGKGILNMRLTNKTGKVVSARMVSENDDVILLTSANKIIRMSVSEVSQTRGRATQGVRLVRMDGDNSVIGFELVMEDEDELKDGAS
jgi:DNA gyrase subunit A